MKITRRVFNITIPALAAALVSFKNIAIAKAATVSNRVPSIEQLINTHFYPLYIQHKNGKPWISEVLNKATKEGRIQLVPLGEVVELGGTGLQYEIEQSSVPVVWTNNDEAKNSTANERMALAKSLIKNSISSAEDVIEQDLLPGHILIISKQYHVTKDEIYKIPNQQAKYFLVYTAYARIPLEIYEKFKRGEVIEYRMNTTT